MQDPLADVSRETSDKLRAFADLVRKWTPKINLVSKASLPDIWERHIRDSAQIYGQVSDWQSWIDIGSGGGFPGIVVAILSAEETPDRAVTLVESDQRKCAFLRTAARELSLNVTVKSQRIEQIPSLDADVLSARALADLTQLLAFAERHLSPNGTALFMKGAQWWEEHDKAQQMWSYDCEVTKSITNPAAALLRIKEIKRV